MCTKHRYKEIKERIETMLEPLRKVKKKKKITSSIKLASTWDDVDDSNSIIMNLNMNKFHQNSSAIVHHDLHILHYF